MNQILSVESPKKEKKNKTGRTGPIEIEKIIKFFEEVLSEKQTENLKIIKNNSLSKIDEEELKK